MEKREKVIKGLECCILHDPDDKPRCESCPYDGACVNRLKRDALKLLKAQEPRVMTLEEVKTAEVVFMEFQDVITTRIVDTWFGNGDGDIRLAGMDGTRYMGKDAYNDSWRCWTSRPTDEQRKAVKWDE